MIYMVGTCVSSENVNNIIGFRLVDVTTGKYVDIAYDDVVFALYTIKIQIENLYLDIKGEEIIELGNNLPEYPIATIDDVEQHNRVMTIIGKCEDTGKTVYIDTFGTMYKANIHRIPDMYLYINRFNIKFTNDYVLKKNNRDMIKSVKYIEDSELEDKIRKYDAKCRLLGIKESIIKNVNGNITLVSVENSVERYHVPEFVTHIGCHAFDGCTKLRDIKLHNNIKYIGDSAFTMCYTLKHIEIPKSVSKIGEEVFSSSGLVSIDIKCNLEEISNKLFSKCYKLRNIKIPDSVRKIGNHAFMMCSELKNIDIPKRVEEIGAGAFSYTNIEALRLDCNISEIPNNLLTNCFKLKEMELTNKIKKIDSYAFFACKSLQRVSVIGYELSDQGHVELPYSIKEIGECTFGTCESIRSINIPRNVWKIGRFAFRGSGLESVDIPGSVEYISIGAFEECSLLENITIRNEYARVEEEAFSKCNKLKDIKIVKERNRVRDTNGVIKKVEETIEVVSRDAIYDRCN